MHLENRRMRVKFLFMSTLTGLKPTDSLPVKKVSNQTDLISQGCNGERFFTLLKGWYNKPADPTCVCEVKAFLHQVEESNLFSGLEKVKKGRIP